eukprot:GFUD01007443.1.p1 GENE.GFUD01007443.1~~GFUD01007443.1.p1  ORF type:complete len:222 (+),score=3.72 GFUD01007443.1:220-885(+)
MDCNTGEFWFLPVDEIRRKHGWKMSRNGWVGNPITRKDDKLLKRTIPGTLLRIVIFAMAAFYHIICAGITDIDLYLVSDLIFGLTFLIVGILESIITLLGIVMAILQVVICKDRKTMDILTEIILRVHGPYTALVIASTVLIGFVVISEICIIYFIADYMKFREDYMQFALYVLIFFHLIFLIFSTLYMRNLYKWKSSISLTYQPLAIGPYRNHVTEFMAL